MLWELTAWNTEDPRDVRFRKYTTSKKKADAFQKIPKIQFSDSGHGIIFWACEHEGKRKPEITTVREHVRKHCSCI